MRILALAAGEHADVGRGRAEVVGAALRLDGRVRAGARRCTRARVMCRPSEGTLGLTIAAAPRARGGSHQTSHELVAQLTDARPPGARRCR